MLKYIWGGMIIVAVISGALTGRLQELSEAVIDGASDGVAFVITLTGIMCLWSGLMKIASESGLVDLTARLLRPVMRFCFPKLADGSPAANAIVMNITANMLGLSNAATPLGINAMKELDRLTCSKGRATDEMCMLVVLNTASIQLIPTTVLSIRRAAGSANPFEIILPVWIVSICAVIVGVTIAKLSAGGQRR